MSIFTPKILITLLVSIAGIGCNAGISLNQKKSASETGSTQDPEIDNAPANNPDENLADSDNKEAEKNSSDTKNQSTGTQPDTISPVASNNKLVASAIQTDSIEFSWQPSTDNIQSQAELVYTVYFTTNTGLSTIAEIKSQATKFKEMTGETATTINGLTPGTDYLIAVIVRDKAGNETLYETPIVKTATAIPLWTRSITTCRNGKGKTTDGGDATTPWDGWVNMSGPIGNVTVQPNLRDVAAVNMTNWVSAGTTIRISGEERTIVSVNSATSLTVDADFSTTHTNILPWIRWPLSDNNVDDYQTSQAGVHYTGAERTNCNVTGLVDVSSTIVPDPAKHAGWAFVFQDQLTGQYFTDHLVSDTWANAHGICAGLNGGTGGDGWYLPTHKELVQLFIHGAGELPLAWGSVVANLWSSTTSSTDALKAKTQYFSTGPAVSELKTTSRQIICMKKGTGTFTSTVCKNGRGITNAGGDSTTPWDDLGAPAGSDLSVDDWQNGSADFYKGADRSNCNETNFSDASATVAPDTGLHANWKKTWRDMLTGVYFTNILEPTTNWQNALTICSTLNNGNSGTGWRLPSQKELLQLYVDGVSRLDFSAGVGALTGNLWSSTTLSGSTSQPYRAVISDVSVASGGAGKGGSSQVLCVRE